MTRQPIAPADAADILRRHGHVATSTLPARAWSFGLPFGIALLTAFSIWWLQISMGDFGAGLVALAKLTATMFPPSTGGHFNALLAAMAETLAIAFLGTLTASLVAFPIAFVAARNTTPSAVLRFFIRRGLDTIRGIDVLIWALVFVGVVGLGPFAGILAIAVSDVGALGKLFSETIEVVDRKPIEGVVAAGGSRLHAVRFALIPQVIPVLMSQALYFFESNVRSATIIGIVGAGGIGLQLSEQIRTYDFDQVTFVIIMILVAVAVIDWICGKLRLAIIGSRPAGR